MVSNAHQIPLQSESFAAHKDNLNRYAQSSPRFKTPNQAFSLIELLVVLAISSLLMALLMPNFIHLRESARQAACSSNMHHIGLAMALYSDEYDEHLPLSFYNGTRHLGGNRDPQPQKMIVSHLASPNRWDAMGLLYDRKMIRSPEVFYCPSHIGSNPFEKYAEDWAHPQGRLIKINYHYRHEIKNIIVPDRQLEFWQRLYATSPILSDGMQTKQDFNHVVGTNMLRLDSSVKWLQDADRSIYNSLPDEADIKDGWVTNPWIEFTRKK